MVAGIGPGDAGHLTPAARAALSAAEVVAGYPLYLDLVREHLAGKELIKSGMRREVERVREAIAAALEGRRVCLVSSGDAGVYGLAGLVLEELARRDLVLPFRVVPGVTAGLAAAALLGAPLAHDHAVISLSDLLTPVGLIKRRVRAAAEADFVLALYNVRSRTRVEPFAAALDILRETRPPETPVGIVRNAFREGQGRRVVTLAELDLDDADMLTLLIVGNTRTFTWRGFMITPRGYLNRGDHDD
ncbi:MAG: precorrin-3B C(17)-methyltransferase [Thermoanaerobacterales bacterium]|nr:precorrin-3B C(17)-methyltransferase [Bacillota bacterium]MDI6906965.1 precorrin-3B C(17)-methyltransferase [Thermoanaerobacterales bacterium]